MKFYYLILCVIACLAVGCVGSKSRHVSGWKIDVKADGSAVIERTVVSAAEMNPRGVRQGPTTQIVNESGVSTELAGNYKPAEKPIEAYGLEIRAWIFYGAAVVAAIAGVVLTFVGYKALGISIGILGGAFAATPGFLNDYGMVIGAMFILSGVIAIGWAIYGKTRRVENKETIRAAQSLADQGDVKGAFETLLSAPSLRRDKPKEK